MHHKREVSRPILKKQTLVLSLKKETIMIKPIIDSKYLTLTLKILYASHS